jgi:hypothetical protein
MLTTELVPLKCATTKESPKHDLGFSHLLAETTSELTRPRFSPPHSATPSVITLRVLTAPP